MRGRVMSKRSERVGELLREEINEVIRREINNPKLGFITITQVKVTNDLQHAKVYYSVYGTEKDKKETSEILKASSSFIRRQIGGRVRLRYTPHIEFFYDRIPEDASHITDLLEKIKKNKKQT